MDVGLKDLRWSSDLGMIDRVYEERNAYEEA